MKEKIFTHVAATINDLSDLENFYIDILGLEIKYKFNIQKNLSKQIFNIEKDVEVVIAGKQDFTMELFIADNINIRNFQHICITVENRGKMLKKAEENNYPCTIIERDDAHDIVFIQDKSNNLFEIKEAKKD